MSRTMNGAGRRGFRGAPPRPWLPIRTPRLRPRSVREKFLPVTRHALLDRLTRPTSGRTAMPCRRAASCATSTTGAGMPTPMKLLELEQVYEPFSPDTDLLHTRTFSAEERADDAQAAGGADVGAARAGQLHARRSGSSFHIILTKESHYGLDLQVDINAFEEILIFYRGATTITERHRDIRKAYIGWKEMQGAGVPAPVHPLQAEALRAARAGGDAGEEGGPRRGREHRAQAAPSCCPTR